MRKVLKHAEISSGKRFCWARQNVQIKKKKKKWERLWLYFVLTQYVGDVHVGAHSEGFCEILAQNYAPGADVPEAAAPGACCWRINNLK